MTTETQQQLRKFVQILTALRDSSEHSLHAGNTIGMGKHAMKSYHGVQAKVAALLPDDFFITESLYINTDDFTHADAEQERHMLSQVQLVAEQMAIYLHGMIQENRQDN